MSGRDASDDNSGQVRGCDSMAFLPFLGDSGFSQLCLFYYECIRTIVETDRI